MASWAAIAKAAPAPEPEPKEDDSKDAKIAVVDANAIINGLRLESIADKAVTIQEVLNEIRDKQSRQFLDMLPFGVKVMEPTEESVKIITRFAKETGDIHSLSAVDMKLLALAHTLEVAAHGSAHLREHPPPPKMAPKHKTRSRGLPGWGNVPNPEDWAAIDEVPDSENAGAVQGSRISQQAQELNLDSGLLDDTTTEQHTEQAEDESESDDGAEEDDDGWEVAARTSNVRRRKQRRQIRYQMRMEAEAEALAALQLSQQKQGAGSSSGAGAATAGAAADGAPSSSQQEQQGHQQQEQQQQQGDGDDYSDEEESDEGSEGSMGQHDGESIAGLSSAEQPAFDSSIASVTADFAMQNVLLQMGLRLVARDGRVINRLSRWALRCQACSYVTKEAGKIFCPRCGNMTLEKVEVHIGGDGAELYGVKKRHVLRGTRYSLPKPKGGRMRNQPILSEDVMKQRLPHLMKPNKKKAKEGAGADPFAPEYGPDSWFAKHQVMSSARAAALLMPGWKNNPNERKLTRSNRRK